MAQNWQLFFDQNNRRLVKGLVDTSPFVLPEITDQDLINIRMQLLALNPDGGKEEPYSIVSPSGQSLTVALAKKSDQSILASQTVFTADGDQLVGVLDLNQTAVIAEVATTFRSDVWFAVLSSDASGYYELHKSIVLLRSIIRRGTPSTSPLASYYTREETNALFLKKIGDPGDTWTATSRNGAYARIKGTNDDGSSMDDAI